MDKWGNIFLIINCVNNAVSNYCVCKVVATGVEETLKVGETRSFSYGSYRHETLKEIGNNLDVAKLLYGRS